MCVRTPAASEGQTVMSGADQYTELLHEAMALGWDPPHTTSYATDAVILTFGRFQGHADPSGATELRIHGKDKVEAMRNAVEQMKKRAAGDTAA